MEGENRIDLDKFLIDTGGFESSPSPPPIIKGTRYKNTEDGYIYEFDGEDTWVRISKGGR